MLYLTRHYRPLTLHAPTMLCQPRLLQFFYYLLISTSDIDAGSNLDVPSAFKLKQPECSGSTSVERAASFGGHFPAVHAAASAAVHWQGS